MSNLKLDVELLRNKRIGQLIKRFKSIEKELSMKACWEKKDSDLAEAKRVAFEDLKSIVDNLKSAIELVDKENNLSWQQISLWKKSQFFK